MNKNDKVLHSGRIYKVIFDYENGQYEIMRDNLLREVLLVSEDEIIWL